MRPECPQTRSELLENPRKSIPNRPQPRLVRPECPQTHSELLENPRKRLSKRTCFFNYLSIFRVSVHVVLLVVVRDQHQLVLYVCSTPTHTQTHTHTHKLSGKPVRLPFRRGVGGWGGIHVLNTPKPTPSPDPAASNPRGAPFPTSPPSLEASRTVPSRT